MTRNDNSQKYRGNTEANTALCKIDAWTIGDYLNAYCLREYGVSSKWLKWAIVSNKAWLWISTSSATPESTLRRNTDSQLLLARLHKSMRYCRASSRKWAWKPYNSHQGNLSHDIMAYSAFEIRKLCDIYIASQDETNGNARRPENSRWS